MFAKHMTVAAVSLAVDHNVAPIRYDRQYNPYLLADVRPAAGKSGPCLVYRKAV